MPERQTTESAFLNDVENMIIEAFQQPVTVPFFEYGDPTKIRRAEPVIPIPGSAFGNERPVD